MKYILILKGVYDCNLEHNKCIPPFPKLKKSALIHGKDNYH